jgi:hypothetical protein
VGNKDLDWLFLNGKVKRENRTRTALYRHMTTFRFSCGDQHSFLWLFELCAPKSCISSWVFSSFPFKLFVFIVTLFVYFVLDISLMHCIESWLCCSNITRNLSICSSSHASSEALVFFTYFPHFPFQFSLYILFLVELLDWHLRYRLSLLRRHFTPKHLLHRYFSTLFLIPLLMFATLYVFPFSISRYIPQVLLLHLPQSTHMVSRFNSPVSLSFLPISTLSISYMYNASLVKLCLWIDDVFSPIQPPPLPSVVSCCRSSPPSLQHQRLTHHNAPHLSLNVVFAPPLHL